MIVKVDSEEALQDAIPEIVKFAGDESMWLFFGEMGAGKTTLIKGIARQYGVEDMVQSPTFSLVNEYRNPENDIFYHFDFYRISNETEALDIGVEEYFESGNHCFIEWPEKIPGLLPNRFLRIDIEIISKNSRSVKLIHHGR